jgi:hypothetical protein
LATSDLQRSSFRSLANKTPDKEEQLEKKNQKKVSVKKEKKRVSIKNQVFLKKFKILKN